MEIKICKEIMEYKEHIFFGMNMRQCLFSALAAVVSILIYFLLHDSLGTETVSWLCIMGATPFAVLGFFRYNGMNAETYLKELIISEFIMPRELSFQAENTLYTIIKGEDKLD